VVAVWVAIHHRAAPSREDRARTLVQPEPIRTTAIRAANAVGFTPIRVLILERARRIDLANADANNGHGRPRMDVELIPDRNPREQVYPTTVADAGQP